MSGLVNNLVQDNLNAARFQMDTNNLKSIKNSLSNTEYLKDKKLKEASQQFEAVFVHKLLQVMDKTVKRSDFMNGGQAEDMFRDMFYQEIAKNISTNETSNFGLGQQVYKQLSQYS